MALRRYVILAIVLIATAGVGWFFLRTEVPTEDALWRFVPADALWVYEHADVQELWGKHLHKHTVQPFLESFCDFSLEKSGATFWQHFQEEDITLQALITALPIKLSGHVLDDNRLGVIFYLSLTEAKKKVLHQLFTPLSAHNFVVSSKQHNTRTIHLIRTVDNKQTLTYLIGQDYFIGSFSPNLLEKVVKTADMGLQAPYLHARQQIQTLTRMPQQDGQLYFSLGAFTRYWPSLWGTTPERVQQKVVRYAGTNALLNAHLLPNHLVWSGFVVTADSSKRALLTGFTDNLPPVVPYLQMIPNSCTVLQRYGFKDAQKWNLHMQNLWQQEAHPVYTQRLALFSQYSVDVETLFSHIGHMGAVLELEKKQGTPTEQLFLMHVKQPQALQKVLANINLRMTKQPNSYHEKYGDYTIDYLELAELPYLLFGEDFAGFSTLFYVQRAGFLMASSSLLTLKGVLDQLDEENSWGHTPSIRAQLSEDITDVNFSLQMNLSKQWPKIVEKLRYPWYIFFQKNTPNVHDPYFLSMQLRVLQDKLYTQLQLRVPPLSAGQTTTTTTTAHTTLPPVQGTAPKGKGGELPVAYKKQAVRRFNSPLISKPLLLYNPAVKRFETFVQEKNAFTLHALQSDGTSRWIVPLEGPIISPIHTLDYFNNGGTQYLFATATAIYLLHATGKSLQGFPLQLPNAAPIAYLNLIDYSKTKNYRFFVADVHGNAYVLNKQGRALPAWDPKPLSPLAHRPFHLRIGQRDCMVLPQKDGLIHMYKRIGHAYPHFPVRIGKALQGELYVERGSTLARTNLVAINHAGTLLKLSLAGEIHSERVLQPRLSKARYQLVPSVLKNGYICLISTPDRLVALNSSGEQLFAQENSLSNSFTAQYYKLDDQHTFIALHDKIQAQSYFYDRNGDNILPSPLPSTQQVALTYRRHADKYTIHLVQQDKYLRLTYKP